MKKRLTRFMTLLLLLAGAIACYLSGMILGVLVLFIIGALLEGLFWGKLLFARRKPH